MPIDIVSRLAPRLPDLTLTLDGNVYPLFKRRRLVKKENPRPESMQKVSEIGGEHHNAILSHGGVQSIVKVREGLALMPLKEAFENVSPSSASAPLKKNVRS